MPWDAVIVEPNRLHSYRHAGRPAVKNFVVNPRTFSYHPPPGSLGFRAIFAAKIFLGIAELSQAKKSGGGYVSFY